MILESAGVNARRALEALRNGVPNHDAVRVLGCNQPEVERRFVSQTEALDAAVREERQAPGLLVAGDFGAGKSHLFQYLEYLALKQNFVCSRIVISKETPLYDPAKIYRAAIEAAAAPGLHGQMLQEIALRLDPRSPQYAELFKWASREDGDVSALFPATLMLHERLGNDPEMVEEIIGFWSGNPMAISRIRQGLRQIGQVSAFALRAVRVRQLALQRFAFTSALVRAAGYRGWILLIDEVELIARYSLLQRGRSYAELARWMGRIDSQQYPGLLAVAAITVDYAAYALTGKGDRDLAPARLASRDTDEFRMLAAQAETGMRIIEREALRLAPLDDAVLQTTYEHLKRLHGEAYGWNPPDVAGSGRSVTRAMRSYVRRWINEWDLSRLYPGAEINTEERELKPSYEEDPDMEREPEGENLPGDGQGAEGNNADSVP